MNKYQLALEVFSDNTKLTQHNIDELQWANEVIIELIDKETPTKPIWEQNPCVSWESISVPLCPKCKANLIINGTSYKRCLNELCEQKIDWSDENE